MSSMKMFILSTTSLYTNAAQVSIDLAKNRPFCILNKIHQHSSEIFNKLFDSTRNYRLSCNVIEEF